MKDQWTDRLSEYLDGELTGAQLEALEAHLAQCAFCQGVLEELRGVQARAAALDDRPPTTDLWPGIASKIGVEQARSSVLDLEQHRRTRRFTFSAPQLLAASIALMLVSGGVGWFTVSGNVPPSGSVALGTTGGTEAKQVAWASDARYDAAIGQLQTALDQGRKTGRLDTTTVRVVEHNLAIIDSAIAQARRALAADPGSAYLNHHLADTMHRKLELLRRATALASHET